MREAGVVARYLQGLGHADCDGDERGADHQRTRADMRDDGACRVAGGIGCMGAGTRFLAGNGGH